ncbi:MAG: PssD/Cps14F family polysaccharide biosynthesis glycosyltransferase [archaeon]|nr:PssD/Cps14F family polysaccharide biosynthesis glycosyltransferase [archaeon]
MKIAFAASAGGHLTQIETIFTKRVIGDNKFIMLTEKNSKTEKLPYKTYFFEQLNKNPLKYFLALIRCIKILKKEKIKLVITTGAEIGLVSMIAGKLLGIKTIFIETIIRVKNPTLSGRLSYPFSDIFLVQNKGMEKHYGKRAKYVGGII